MSKPKSAVTPHPFLADPETPADPVSGAEVCVRCSLVGRSGDAHHSMPEPAPDARSRAAGEDLTHRSTASENRNN
ncbi:hypothetical protein [Actinoplanes palleronii]|uniref:Uncharacterized protein n=1 Tax=Actinoplanes palleronii TaxID=113570 RepID=A0ABQ4BJB3_9ACTN|nr:hypothetical protein [Actinoplanes palleronii]GIE70758.1 hypothetical protein Apa02nite_068660 [Actinoplanes palleronii]